MIKIGLEIHCQLTKLESKLFCTCRAYYRDFEPNTNICPVCVGLPGSLPRLNREAVRWAAKIAMALGCRTPERMAFFRKNYFYPDLPKNFQITQTNLYGETCAGSGGVKRIGDRDIRIRRVQLEEDPGRIIYSGSSEKTQITLVDYNRAGTPLVEIVTEPDFEEPRQVRGFLMILSDLLENLQVSDPGLEGAMRADGNVSVSGGSKVEVKNVNSFHDLEKALRYEIARQQSLVERGIVVEQETRHWDDRRKITVPARSKEGEMDYRYLLEGDIPWIRISSAMLDHLRRSMPESISSRRERYVTKYGIVRQVADVLSSDRYCSDLFEEAHDADNAREVANIITTDLMGLIDTREKRRRSRLTGAHLRSLAGAILSREISRSSAKTALQEMVRTGRDLAEISAKLDLGGISDASKLEGIIDEVIQENSGALGQAGKNPQIINYLVGRVMQKTGGRADPGLVIGLLRRRAGI